MVMEPPSVSNLKGAFCWAMLFESNHITLNPLAGSTPTEAGMVHVSPSLLLSTSPPSSTPRSEGLYSSIHPSKLKAGEMNSSTLEAMISLMTSDSAVASLWFTVSTMVPFLFEPSVVVAMMVTVPAPTAVTSPVSSTVATVGRLLVHATFFCSVLAGSTVAVNCSVSPTSSCFFSAPTLTLCAFTMVP